MWRLLMPVLLVVLLVACRGREGEGFLEGAEQTATDSATHPASPGGAALVPDVSAGTTVVVTLEDNRIVVVNPDQIPTGPAIFTITNAGAQVHGLFLEGEGMNVAATEGTIAAGGTGSLEVNLKAGTYTLYCPVLDHRQKGEAVTLVIRSAASPATSTAIPTT